VGSLFALGGAVISAGRLGPLQLTRRGMVIELSINLTVDCSGLEAGVGVTKRYQGCHRSRAVCDEVLPAAECLDVVLRSSAAMA
jgi:hypothetical protein